jgi:hypothetical protein
MYYLRYMRNKVNGSILNVSAYRIIVIFMLVMLKSIAQTPYELFNSKSEQFYSSSSSGSLKGLKPDSTKVMVGDSIYYHYRIHGTTNTCTNARKIAWIGSRTIRKGNGDWLFFNKLNDTILIKPYATNGTQWIYYRFTNGDYIKATMGAVIYATSYHTFSDSIKTITFQCYNASNAPIANSYNNQILKIGRTQGLLSSGDYYNFPSNVASYQRVFAKRLKRKDIYDNLVGDQYQRVIYQTMGSTTISTQLINEIVLSKNYVNPDSVEITYTLGGASTFIRRHGQLNQYYYKEMPEQGLITGSGSSQDLRMVNYSLLWSGNCLRTSVSVANIGCGTFIVTPQDTCFNIPSLSCFPPGNLDVYEMSGGPYLNFAGIMGPNSTQTLTSITFQKHNGMICGAPLSISAAEQVNLNSTLQLYPNPSSDAFYIKDNLVKNETKYQLSLMDVGGRIIKQISVEQETPIDIKGLTSGIYMVKITNAKQTAFLKLVKP